MRIDCTFFDPLLFGLIATFSLKGYQLCRITKIFNWLLYFSVNFLQNNFCNTARVTFVKCSSSFLFPYINPLFYKTFYQLVSLCVTHYPNPPKNTYLSFLCFYSTLPFPLHFSSWQLALEVVVYIHFTPNPEIGEPSYVPIIHCIPFYYHPI